MRTYHSMNTIYIYNLTIDGQKSEYRSSRRLDYRKTYASAKAEGHTLKIDFIGMTKVK